MFPFRPCARAMFATEAPGTSASATTRFLKPTEYLPRRASRQVAILDVHLTARRTSKSALLTADSHQRRSGGRAGRPDAYD